KVYQHILIVRAYQDVEMDDLALDQSGSAVGQLTPGSSAPEPAGTGSSSSTTTPRSQAPAEVIPHTSTSGTDAGHPPEPRPINKLYERILIPIDTSRRAECSLPAASMLAERSGATLVLAAVIRRPEIAYPVERSDEVHELTQKLMQISQASAAAYLGEIQGRLNIDCETRIVENDSVPLAIHDLAEEENASLVVFCAHGYTGRMTWPYGSVVQNYIDHGTRPVLVVQDMPRSQVRPTAAELAAEKYGRR
ncbi:MAG: universal stress protein, partial [Anaerolineaceae bacterium]|nr:universal stress protein [Anaerolineaceae bacterium]